MCISIGYPDLEDEIRVLARHMDPVAPTQRVLDPQEILTMQQAVHGIHRIGETSSRAIGDH
jgi:MoxR-like ATPase